MIAFRGRAPGSVKALYSISHSAQERAPVLSGTVELAKDLLSNLLKVHAKQIDEARRHVLRNLVLDERDVTRLGLYERQIASQFKSTYSLLERARAWRLGMPVPPPVSVDLTVSKGHDANGV
jgi:hypothetical protein